MKMKHVLAAILSVLVLLGTVACSPQKNVPNDYMSVSQADEIFDLYVPKNWQSNTESGMSGGYSSLTSGIMANANTFVGSADVTLSEYADATIRSYEKTLENFEKVTEPKATTMGSYAALQFDYKATVSGRTVKFRSTLVKKDNTFTILTCCAPEVVFESEIEVFDKIATYFSFRDGSKIETEEPFVLVDENTPAGYQLAARSKYEFRFYVPDTWTVDTTGNIPSATFSATDLSNVSVTSFAVNQSVFDGKTYWADFKQNYRFDLTEVSSDETAKMGKYDAFAVEYTTKIGETQEYYVKQVFLATPSIIYIFTYTSDADSYAVHMDEVDTMLSMFEFK